MFFLLNKCFLELKTSNYIHKYSQIAFASDWVANAKKGHAPFFSLVHPISFLLHTPYFCHPHRPTRMLVSTDADDFCWCFAVPNLYFRAAKPLLSQCQTFTFVQPNSCFCGSKPPFLHFTLSFSCNIFLCFPRSVVLSCCVHPLVAVFKTVSCAYNNIMCASTIWCFNCK